MIPNNFDFTEFVGDIDVLRNVKLDDERLDNKTKELKIAKCLVSIKNQLNKLFTDSRCTNVIVSDNTDKEFFGIIVRPVGLDGEFRSLIPNIYRLNISRLDKQICPEASIHQYILDIDSKLLLHPSIKASQIARLIIYDIDKITSKDTLIDLMGIIDSIVSGLGMTLPEANMCMTDRTVGCYLYAVYETIYRTTSVCCKTKDDLVLASDILKWQKCNPSGDEGILDVVQDFDDAVDIVKSMGIPEDKGTCPTLVLNWFFTWAKDFKPQDTYPIKLMKRAKLCTGSEAMIYAINKAIEGLGAPASRYRNEKVVTEGAKKGLIAQMKYSGMKSLEDDLFEYSMRVKNIDDENSAILLMRQINSRMGLISDYLESESENLNEHERKRWEKLYDKYDKLRDQMVAKPIYSRKMYGLFVDYNALMNMNNPQNFMTMNTMY